jgi:hypothetical protein
MTRHRERRRQGTRCVTVDVSQSELDALVVRGYLSEGERIMVLHSKRRSRAYSQTWCSSFSPKLLSALELASDRSIRRNASQVGEQFHVTRHRRDSGCTQRGTRVIGGSCCACVRNSWRTCIREPLTAVWAGTLNSWMMRRSFRFCQYRIEQTTFFSGPNGFRRRR